jgi:hypothetical protein
MKTANRRRTPALNNRAHAEIDDYLKRKLQDPEFRAVYEAEDSRIELMRLNKPAPPKKKTRAEVLAAIKVSKMKFDMSWDELRQMTREP